MDITSGKRDFEGGLLNDADLTLDDLRRTYDRLRKQSYRRYERNLHYRYFHHAIYVAGVRQALNAVLREAEDGLV